MSDPTIPWYLSTEKPSELVSGAHYPHAREEAEYWVKLLAEPKRVDCHWCARPWTEPAGEASHYGNITCWRCRRAHNKANSRKREESKYATQVHN